VISRLVGAVLRAPVITVGVALVVAAAGLGAFRALDIEAYPNPVPPMIEIIAQPEGWSAEEVERFVTVPLEIALQGIQGLEHVRSQSLFELSDIKCYFSWATTYKDARQEVLNRIQLAALPANLQPQISPWTPIGEVFRYVVKGDGYSLRDLKTAQDWILEKQFRQVPGVVDVTGFGGETKEYHVEIDPSRLRAYGVSLTQVTAALASANRNAGGNYLALGEQSFVVRGVGLIRSLKDIGDVVVTVAKGTPVRMRDIAQISVGAAPRLGVVGRDAQADVVQGIVLMRYGGNTMETLAGVHARIDLIRRNHLLPPGMDLEPYYDRSELVRLTTHTVFENLLLGMLLVTIILVLFLGHARAALITAINIPLALLIAFIGMVATGTPANLISLGAVDFGIVVDSTVIMMENVFSHLRRPGPADVETRIRRAAGEVGPPMFSSTLIIAVAFVPLFALTGVAGVIFSPMAHTYAFAIGGAILCALTLTPVLARLGLRHLRPAPPEARDAGAVMRGLDRLYRPLFDFGMRRPKLAVLLGLVPVLVAGALATQLGGTFMPKLEEGNFWIRATLPTSIALEQSAGVVGLMRRIVLGCPTDERTPCTSANRTRPEVLTVVSQVGRPDDGTDVSGFSNIELYAPLRPSSQWPRGVTKAGMTAELHRQLSRAFPGIVFNFSQAISDNVEEAISGVKGENTVKVVGPDLRMNEKKAREISHLMSAVPGVQDLGLFRSLGQPDIRISPDRGRTARFGLNVGDVEAIVAAAVGGQAVTQVYEGEKRFDLTVRWAAPFRKDMHAIRNLLVTAPDGAQAPLSELATVVEEDGPVVIYREDNLRYTAVKFSVRGRDLASTIGDAQTMLAKHLKLPYDTHLEWAGEINQLHEATRRLRLIVPITLLMIAFVVYTSVGGLAHTLIVLLGIPVAASGGLIALFITRTELSISAAMGFISILGIAVQDALIVVTYAQRLWAEGHGLAEGARLAAERRLRPVLMTTSVAMLGLLPAALSRGIGSETQKPLAIVVIGGAIALMLLPRLIQAPLLVLAGRFRGHGTWPTPAGSRIINE
jgi:cobalt-zinc-cadmium resistance protein CzcA